MLFKLPKISLFWAYTDVPKPTFVSFLLNLSLLGLPGQPGADFPIHSKVTQQNKLTKLGDAIATQ